MSESVTSAKPRSRWARVRWWVSAAVVAYLVCWGLTWVFAPAALNRWWNDYFHTSVRRLHGDDAPSVFRTGVAFKGERMNYGPDFDPEKKWWCGVGKPWTPAPFVVASEIAWQDAGLSGFAGTIYFLWTPFGMVMIHEQQVWVS